MMSPGRAMGIVGAFRSRCVARGYNMGAGHLLRLAQPRQGIHLHRPKRSGTQVGRTIGDPLGDTDWFERLELWMGHALAPIKREPKPEHRGNW